MDIAILLRLFQAHCIGNWICFLLKRAPNYVEMFISDYGKLSISENLCSENPRRKKVFEKVVEFIDYNVVVRFRISVNSNMRFISKFEGFLFENLLFISYKEELY